MRTGLFFGGCALFVLSAFALGGLALALHVPPLYVGLVIGSVSSAGPGIMNALDRQVWG